MKYIRYYCGYTFDEKGIKVWPRKKYKYLWADLVSIESLPSFTMFHFAEDKDLKVPNAGTRKSLQKYLSVISLAVGNAREDIYVSEHTSFVLEYGSQAGSVKELRKKLKENPADARTGMLLANITWAMSGTPKSLAIVEKALTSSPGDLELRRLEALLLALVPDKRIKAFIKLESILKDHPDDVESTELLAELLLAENDENGLELARRVINQKPESVEIRRNIVGYLTRNERYKEAIDLLTEMLDLQPDGCTADMIRMDIEQLQSIIDEPGRYKKEKSKARRKMIFARGWNVIIILYLLGICVLSWYMMGSEITRGIELYRLRDSGVCTPGRVKSRREGWIRYSFIATPASRISGPEEMPAASEDDKKDKSQLIDELLNSDMEKLSAEEFLAKCREAVAERDQAEGRHVKNEYLGNNLLKQVDGNRRLQYVHYLEDDPEICAIGPITNKRIWFSWFASEGKAKSMIFVVFSIYFAIYLPLDWWRKKRERQKSIFLRSKQAVKNAEGRGGD